MKLAILIPMTDAALKEVEVLVYDSARRLIWPELYAKRPMLPAEIGPGVEAALRDWLGRCIEGAVIVTRSEHAVLRAQRMVAEGAPIEVTIHFPGSAHPMATVGPNGEVDTWPVGLFAEDFEEVRAMRWAAEQRARAGGV